MYEMGKTKKKSTMVKGTPILQAAILADDVYTDAASKKKIIAGTFNQLWSSKFPSQLTRTTKAYLVLTNCHGPQKLKIRYVDLEDGGVLLESPEIELAINDPLERHEVVMEVPPFPMPHEGKYDFEVYCNGSNLGHIQINVGKMKSPRSKK